MCERGKHPHFAPSALAAARDEIVFYFATNTTHENEGTKSEHINPLHTDVFTFKLL